MPGYNPLFKVVHRLKQMMVGMRRVLQPGKHVAINESTIAYMSREVAFVQYMRAKPIKHGIKVYSLCCAVLTVLLTY